MMTMEAITRVEMATTQTRLIMMKTNRTVRRRYRAAPKALKSQDTKSTVLPPHDSPSQYMDLKNKSQGWTRSRLLDFGSSGSAVLGDMGYAAGQRLPHSGSSAST